MNLISATHCADRKFYREDWLTEAFIGEFCGEKTGWIPERTKLSSHCSIINNNNNHNIP